MSVMQELRLSIKRLVDKLFPWQRGLMTSSSEDCVTTSQLIETIDALVYDDVNDNQTQVILRNYTVFSLFILCQHHRHHHYCIGHEVTSLGCCFQELITSCFDSSVKVVLLRGSESWLVTQDCKHTLAAQNSQ